MCTCRTRSTWRSSNRDSRPAKSGWHSRSCSERRLSSVTAQSCWVLPCSCSKSCRHTWLWGSAEGSEAGTGAQPGFELHTAGFWGQDWCPTPPHSQNPARAEAPQDLSWSGCHSTGTETPGRVDVGWRPGPGSLSSRQASPSSTCCTVLGGCMGHGANGRQRADTRLWATSPGSWPVPSRFLAKGAKPA